MSDYCAFAAVSITVAEILPGFKSVFKCTIPDSGKVNLQFTCLYKLCISIVFNHLKFRLIFIASDNEFIGGTTILE